MQHFIYFRSCERSELLGDTFFIYLHFFSASNFRNCSRSSNFEILFPAETQTSSQFHEGYRSSICIEDRHVYHSVHLVT